MTYFTRPNLLRDYGHFEYNSTPWQYEPYDLRRPGPRHAIRTLDFVELATLQVRTQGFDWTPVFPGGLASHAARLSSWDGRGELVGLSGTSVARRLQDYPQPRASSGRIPWIGLRILADLDADSRTGVMVTVDGAPRGADDWASRRVGERLRDRLAGARLVRERRAGMEARRRSPLLAAGVTVR